MHYEWSDMELAEYGRFTRSLTQIDCCMFIDESNSYRRWAHPLWVVISEGSPYHDRWVALSVSEAPQIVAINEERTDDAAPIPTTTIDECTTFIAKFHTVIEDIAKEQVDSDVLHQMLLGEAANWRTLDVSAILRIYHSIKDKYLLDDSQRSYIEDIEEYGKHNIHELATVGGGKWGTRSYKAMIHGISPKDRHKPHIHIYLYDETNYENPRFNFEVSFEDIVSKDEINLLHQLDKEYNIYTSDCSWDGYEDLLEGLRGFLFAKPADKHLIGYVDNLEYAIERWNMETDFNYAEKGTNPMKRYFDEHNIHILDKFTDYFEN